MDRDEGREAAEASIPGEQHDVANASRRDLLRAALFDTPLAERRVGRFVVRGVLGRGGMGTVLEAFDEVLDRPVAVKLLHPTLAHREAQLLAEARALARLSHPNVVQVYEAGKAGDHVYLAMELVRGQTLRKWQDEERPGWRACVEAYVQAGRGLAAAHARGLVHRDFKPSNCIRDPQGRVRVLDFGLVRHGAEVSAVDSGVVDAGGPGHDEVTQPGQIFGTPAYMAPEILRGDPADARSDQYAFCVALYEALLGRHPFGPDGPARREAMLHGALDDRGGTAKVPASLRRTLVRGLAVQPAARWPDMDTLLRTLDPARRAERRAWQVAVVVGLVGAGGLYAWLTRPEPPCRSESPRLAREWSPARQEAVRAGLVASGSPLSEPTWERLQAHVDAYLRSWSEARSDVCVATHVRGEQSEALMDRRMACLDLRLDAVASLLRALEHAHADTVLRATQAALQLPDPASCRSAAVGEDPQDDTARRLEQQLVELRTAVDLGDLDRRTELVALREEARAAGLPRLVAQSQFWEGVVSKWSGDIDAAEALLETAAQEALAVADDELALLALLEQIELRGVVRLDPARAQAQLPWAAALLRRQGEPAALRVRYLIGAGNVLARAGRYAEAQDQLDEALALAPTLPEPRLPYELALSAAGVLAQLSGRSADAEALFEQLLAHDRVTYGDRHPNVATTLNNLAVAEANNGDLVGAERRLEDALAIERAVNGDMHPLVGDALMNLGGVRRAQRPVEALAAVEEARAIYVAVLGETAAKTVAADFARGQILERLGRREEAEPLYRRVLEQRRRMLGERHPELVWPARALGELLAATGRQAEAEPLLELAAAIEREVAAASGEPR